MTSINISSNISERLKYVMKITGLRITDLAKMTKVKRQTIHSLCVKNSQTSKYYLPISNALGVNLVWLMTGQGDIFLKKNENNFQKSLTEDNNINFLETQELLKICQLEKFDTLENFFISKTQEDINDPYIKKGSDIYIARENDATRCRSGDLIVLYNKQQNKLFIAKLTIKEKRSFITLKNEIETYTQNNHTIINLKSFDETYLIGKIIRYCINSKEYVLLHKHKGGADTT